MQINWKSLKADLGGRWFLYRKSLIPLAPLLTITSVLATSNTQVSLGLLEQDVALRYLLLLAANVASILLCWLYIELASATIFRNRSVNPINWIVVLVFGASVGFLKGLSTGAFSFLFGSENNLEAAISNRIVQTSFLGLWTLPVLTLVTATYFRYQSEREALIAERVKISATSESIGEVPDHQVALRSFIAESKSKISELQTLSQGSPDPATIARTLRKLIEEGLRPISHQIWLTEQKSRSGFRLRDLTLLALDKNPFPMTFVGLSVFVGLFPLNLVAYSPFDALVLTTVTIALILGILGLFLFLNKVLRVHPVLLFLAGNIAASILGFWLTALIFGADITEESLILMLSLLLWLLQISLFASVLTEVLTSRSEVRAELLKLTGNADINTDVARAANRFASRALAQHVHSNIQNQLLARALTLDDKNLTEAEIELQLSEVQKLLDLALDTSQVANQESLLASLEEIVERWRGFVRIDLDFELDQNTLDPIISQALVQVVGEAISNSVRHGLAQTVSIRIADLVSDESVLEVTIADDGLGPRSGPTGLGTELFTSVSRGSWQIKSRAAGGTELSLQIQKSQ
jgi:two-component sensor histidine kinase